MNQRIKELSVEAAYGVVDPNGPFTAEEFVNFQQKFAQLIVRECTDVLNRRFMGDLNREDQEVRRCIADVKKHFGVEE